MIRKEIGNVLGVSERGFFTVNGKELYNKRLDKIFAAGIQLTYFGEEFVTYAQLKELVRLKGEKDKQNAEDDELINYLNNL